MTFTDLHRHDGVAVVTVIYQKLSYGKIGDNFHKRKFIHWPSQTATPDNSDDRVDLNKGQIQKVLYREIIQKTYKEKFCKWPLSRSTQGSKLFLYGKMVQSMMVIFKKSV